MTTRKSNKDKMMVKYNALMDDYNNGKITKKPFMFTCEECQYYTMNSGSFYNHNKRIHDGRTMKGIKPKDKYKGLYTRVDGSDEVNCNTCKKELRSLHAFRSHYNVVHKLDKVTCEVCHREYGSNKTLRRHMKTHE